MKNTEKLAFFHDAELTCINHQPENNSIEMHFKFPAGDISKILLLGLSGFRALDFSLQNVVSRIKIHDCNSPSNEFGLEENIAWTFKDSKDNLLITSEKLDHILDGIKSGRLNFFNLEPSWGAAVSAVFERIQIE